MPIRLPAPNAPAARRPRGRVRAGYTLVELLVALVIMGVMVAAVTPRVNRGAYDADAGARVVVGALQAAQRLAVTQQSTVVVGFDTAGRRMRVLEDRNGNLHYDPAVVDSERVTWRPLDPAAVRFAQPPAGVNGAVSGSLASVATVVDGLPSVVFRRDGAASDNVEAYLSVARGGAGAPSSTEWRGVTIARATGRVTWWALGGVAATGQSVWKQRGI